MSEVSEHRPKHVREPNHRKQSRIRLLVPGCSVGIYQVLEGPVSLGNVKVGRRSQLLSLEMDLVDFYSGEEVLSFQLLDALKEEGLVFGREPKFPLIEVLA